MKAEKTSGFNINFDILNIVCCLCVVLMHVNSAYWEYEGNSRWALNCFIGCFASFAVPVFFCLSGAKLIDYNKRYSTKEYFKKRFLKTVVPFLVWSAFAVAFSFLRFGMQGVTAGNFIPTVVDMILNTKANENYWFFIPLFTAYIAIPVFAAVKSEARERIFAYSIIAGTVLNSTLPFVFSALKLNYNYSLSFPTASAYLIFVLIGYYISHYEIKKRSRIIIYICGIVCLLLNFGLTAFCSFRAGTLTDVLSDNLQFARVIWSTAVFTFFYYGDFSALKSEKAEKIIRKISSASFGIFLIHYFVLQTLFWLFDINVFSRLWLLWGTAAVYAVSLAVVLILKRIPLLKKLVP